MAGKRGRSLQERFEGFYIPEPNTGCWLWIGATHPKGYGQIWDGVKGPAKAHVLAYRLFKGDIPSGHMIRHKCDVRCCVNPDHLLTGAAQDNVDDAVTRGRHQFGSRHGAAKLSEGQALAILTDPRSSHTAIAKDYGVSAPTVYGIRSRRKWKHLAPRLSP